jgi:PAS domain S-box-containing protein
MTTRRPVPGSAPLRDDAPLETSADLVAELRRSEARYRALAEAGALDVIRLRPDGTLLSDMPGWRALTGGSTPLYGAAWLMDVHPDDRARMRSYRYTDGPPSGEPLYVEFRVVAADGVPHLLIARMLPLRRADGHVLEWIGRIEDVTEERAAQARTELLAATTAELARAVTVDDVAGCVFSIVLPLLGAHSCGLHVAENGEVSPAVALLPSPGYLAGRPADRPVPVETAARDAAPGFRERPTASAALPLLAGTTPLGVWHLVWDGPRVFDAAERAFLCTLSAQIAQALSRAQLFEHSASTARLLQRALLPERLPPVPGLEVAARYRSPTGSDVGGDWYDVLHLNDGTAGLVLGDVMGRGVRAASTMGQVRNALRGIAVVDPTPSGMLTGLDRFFRDFDPDEITTLVITVIDTATGRLHVGNAGHLPPLLLRADGRSGPLDDGASTPLGVPTERVACKGTSLLPGDLLVMCSDGLIERRHSSLSERLAVLERAARRLADRRLPLEEMADALLAEVLDGSPTDDDVSLLLVRLPGDG